MKSEHIAFPLSGNTPSPRKRVPNTVAPECQSGPFPKPVRSGTDGFKVLGICMLAATLSACSVSSTLSPQEPDRSLITSSVAKPAKENGIDDSDAEVIKSVVANANAQGDTSNMLAWQNPDTGNQGTIMAIDEFVGSHGQKCKKFQTTADTFMGISLYNGETCELKKGFWVLSWFMRQTAE